MISYKNQKVKCESQNIITVFLEMSRKIFVYCKNTFVSIPFHSGLYESVFMRLSEAISPYVVFWLNTNTKYRVTPKIAQKRFYDVLDGYFIFTENSQKRNCF